MEGTVGEPTTLASVFILPNGTFIFELVSFFILLWLLHRYVIPPISRMMDQRQETIKKQIDESREAKERLEKAEQDYKEALSEARAEATQLKDEARAEAKRLKEELTAKAHEEAANIAAAHQRQLEIDRQRAMADLRREIGDLAVQLAGRIVGESLEDEARRSRTVDRFIEEVEGSAAAADTAGEPAGQGR